jgi:hypothetical protein
LARIVPDDPDSPVVKGVKVITADGSQIRGIKKLTLVAEPNSLWTANIEMSVLPPVGLTAEYETTDVSSTEREFSAGCQCLSPTQKDELEKLYQARLEAARRSADDTMRAILREMDELHLMIACTPRGIAQGDAEAIGNAVAQALSGKRR